MNGSAHRSVYPDGLPYLEQPNIAVEMYETFDYAIAEERKPCG
jgi:hypothetical protein